MQNFTLIRMSLTRAIYNQHYQYYLSLSLSLSLILLKLTQRDPGHLPVPVFQLLQTHCEKVVPVVEEEGLLRDAQQAGDEREDGETVLCLGAHVERLRVELLHKVLQTRNVYLVLHGLKEKKRERKSKSKIKNQNQKSKSKNSVCFLNGFFYTKKQ
jgi:hypothetical protein